MNSRKKLMPYLEERAIEDVAFARGLTPSRVFAILLPVWQVEVRATITDGRPYQLIDRYLERGIAEAGLCSVTELARFFSLDEPLVDRAVRFLTGIGHITLRDGRLGLTALGARSHRDQLCYVVEREDRRKMYFEAFSSRPLSRPYYDTGTVTFLSAEKVKSLASDRVYPRFVMLSSNRGFRHEALTELAGHADRDQYNLPFRIERPESIGEECVYLPMYLVRAIEPGGAIRYFAYSQVADTADRELSELCEQLPEIRGVVESEALAVRPGQHEERIGEWLRDRGLGQLQPARTGHGVWRVTLPASAFKPVGTVPLSKLGSFVVLATGLVSIWCGDEETRQRALLQRVDAFVASRTRHGAVDLVGWVERLGRQLGLPPATPGQVREMALRAGKDSLAARLADLLEMS